LLGGWLLITSSHASMILDRTILTFSPGEPPRQDVSVKNPDNENLYLEVSVLEVTDPGTENETREVVKDPESIGLVAAPRLLMVPPGGSRTIRLVNLNGHADTEKVYRVNVTPAPPPTEAKGMAIRVLIAYQLLIFVEPTKPAEDLVAIRNGRILKLHNKGNINVLLTDGQQCQSEDRNSCTEVQGKRLYPGNKLSLELPHDSGPVFFRVTSGGENTLREF
jgi:P pilus assembly chaperone PapD